MTAKRLDGIEAQIWASAYGAAYVVRTTQGEPGHAASTRAIEIANEAVAHYTAIVEAVATLSEPPEPAKPKRRFWGG